ncbi:MAG: hypothetical protein MHM6MM_003320 [Cercozoa sp. M6MM]
MPYTVLGALRRFETTNKGEQWIQFMQAKDPESSEVVPFLDMSGLSTSGGLYDSDTNQPRGKYVLKLCITNTSQFRSKFEFRLSRELDSRFVHIKLQPTTARVVSRSDPHATLGQSDTLQYVSPGLTATAFVVVEAKHWWHAAREAGALQADGTFETVASIDVKLTAARRTRGFPCFETTFRLPVYVRIDGGSRQAARPQNELPVTISCMLDDARTQYM